MIMSDGGEGEIVGSREGKECLGKGGKGGAEYVFCSRTFLYIYIYIYI